jgi:hypothetical protein
MERAPWAADAPGSPAPEWLAELLLAPPAWVWWVGGLCILAWAVGALLAYRRVGLDAEVVVEMVTNCAILAVTWRATALVAPGPWPYLVDVAVGLAAGLAVAWGLVRPTTRSLIEQSDALETQSEPGGSR